MRARQIEHIKRLLSGVQRGQTGYHDGFNFIQFPKNGPAKGHPILDRHDDRRIDYLGFEDLPPCPQLGSILEVVAALPRNALDGSRRSSFRSGRAKGKECGIHVENDRRTTGTDPVYPLSPTWWSAR